MKVKILCFFIPFLFFINALAQAPPWHWARQGATNGDEYASDVCADPLSSGVYVGGSFTGNLNSAYGSSLTASSGQTDGFILKYDGAGTIVWAFKIGGSGVEVINAVAADPAGDLYVLGSFNGTCDFDPAATTSSLTSNSRDGFLAKYSSAGAFQWVVKFGGTSNDDGNGISADANGVYITGDFTGLSSFNTTSGLPSVLNSMGDEDIFGAKYNSFGVLQWVVRQGDSKTDIGNEVIADGANVYFIGTYDKDISLFNATGGAAAASHVSENNNQSSVIISSYTQAGALVWSNNISSTDDNRGHGITQDNNNIYITGSVQDVAKFKYPSPTFTLSASNQDIFVACLSKSAGVFQWVSTQTGSGAGIESAYDIEVISNKLIVTGIFTGPLDYTPYGGTLMNASNTDPFVTAFDLNGNYLWNAPYGGSGYDNPLGMDVNSSGGIFLCGSYSSGISFGNINLPAANSNNIFVAKLGCDSILVNTISASQTICTGNVPMPLTGTVVAGYNYSFQWESSTDNQTWASAGNSATTTIFTPPSLTVSTYFRRVVMAMAGCTNYSNSASVLITVDQIPAANAGASQTVCISSPSVTLGAVTPTSGTGMWTLVSGNGTIAAASQPTSAVTALASGTTIFEWSVSNGICPPGSSTVAIFVVGLPSVADAGKGDTLCGQSVTLTATPPLSGAGSWSLNTGSGNISGSNLPVTSVTGLGNGTNSFIWKVDNTVCPASYDTVWIVSDAMPAAPVAGSSKTICSAGIIMNAVSPTVGSGVWSLLSGSAVVDNAALNSSMVNSLAIGDNIFRWTVTNGVCPPVFDDVTIHRETPPDSAYAGPDQKVDMPVAQLAATSPTSGTGSWQILKGNGTLDDATNASALLSGLSVGDNSLRWTVSKGSCPPNTSDVHIFMDELKIPDGFSPNGDGINDTYVVPGMEYYDQVEFSVFNRWGGLVFQDLSYKNTWTGHNMNNELLADDTYYYVLKIRTGMNYSGYVILKASK